ncbi:MAG TPA: right-handed parallel beta-helix repeat-containing protein [Candidatus Eisenbacteria bacterium]
MTPASAIPLPCCRRARGPCALAVVLALAAMLTGSPPARARTWHLTPGGGDAVSIQAAIDSAADGDTLLLATGIYSERSRIVNKTLYMFGAGVERTTLDGGAQVGEHGHTLQIRGTGNYSEVRDLTIRDGNANSPQDIDGGEYGGGVLGVEANFAIIGCRFLDNSCSSLGGGLFATSLPLIQLSHAGGGSRSTGPRRAQVAGPRDEILVQDCLFENNFGGSEGGGVCFDQAYFRVVNCTFRHNFSGQGGGAAIINAVGSVSLSLFVDNEAILDGGGLQIMTGLALPPPTIRIFQNTFVKNRCDRHGSGLALYDGTTIEVNANVFDGQTGGAFSVLGCANGAIYAGGCNLFGTNASPPLEGCPPIETDVFGPPMFCNAEGGDYRVCTNSPAAVSSGNCPVVKGIGVGCTGVACATVVRPATWSGIKLLVR